MSKKVSLEELKQHRDRRSLWIAINDNVYDVTKFLEEHPGGEEVLLEQAGSYATDAFEDVGHSTDARDLMKQYHIGELVDSDKEGKAPKPPMKFASADQQSSLTAWLVPLAIAVVATIGYYYLH